MLNNQNILLIIAVLVVLYLLFGGNNEKFTTTEDCKVNKNNNKCINLYPDFPYKNGTNAQCCKCENSPCKKNTKNNKKK